MASPAQFVVYYAVPHHSSGEAKLYANQAIAQQEKLIQDFLKSRGESTVVKTFIESGDNFRYRHRWPELEAAIEYCLDNQANLLIPEIKHLTHNEHFSTQILRLINGHQSEEHDYRRFDGDIFCCDQPYITKDNFAAIAEHAKQQKMLHGQLIRAGLSRTSAKSGNPHALDLITKVNKPKIENAIVFALMLQPVIMDYRAKGLSQRKMVNTLNEEGFTAPEGGHWVLSQLQKVLERIKLNELAMELEKRFRDFKAQGLNSTQIAKILNESNQRSPAGDGWTEESVQKIQDRISRIHEILNFYKLAVGLIPILEKYNIDELTDSAFMNELQKAGITHPWGHA